MHHEHTNIKNSTLKVIIAKATKSIYIFVQHTNNKIVIRDFRHFRY